MTGGATGTDGAAPRPPLREAVTGLVRTRVLDSVGELLRVTPWDKVSMAAIADQAGVSRQTLYNEFGTRDDLAIAYVLRETATFLAEVEAAVTSHADDMHAALRSAVRVFSAAAAEHPVLSRIAAGDTSDALLALVLGASDAPVVSVATDRLVAVLRETWPAVDPVRLTTLADGAVRLAISHATQPGDADRPDVDAEAVIAILTPYIDRYGSG